MTKKSIKNILIIGSGPIIIGQACEFDYSGTQACLSLKEEGYNVSLINNNPATIMTDENIANKVHIVPINCEEIEKIIVSDKIDAILPNCGGQTALNLSLELNAKGILDKYGVEILGVNLETIKYSEDRLLFKQKMEEINIPVCKSIIVKVDNLDNQDDIEKELKKSVDFADKIGYPLVIRPSFTLGGTGGGVANNEEELKNKILQGMQSSPVFEVLIEQSIYGWKEIEYEIIRDKNDNCICVCDMENVDPVGVHTGDSIVVAPTQTITKEQNEMLKQSAMKVVKVLDIKGACNVQFGLHPTSGEYYIIEVNPRTSRSSALASKATAYPIARITSKIAVGKTLDEIPNNLSGKKAIVPPKVNYIVCKMPSFSFDKFNNASHQLGTQMKATGEYMGIGYTFEEAFLKCFDVKKLVENIEKYNKFSTNELLNDIETPTDYRIYEILELLSRNVEPKIIEDATKINKWFLEQLKHLFYKVKNKWNGKKKIVIKLGNKKKPCFRAIDGTGCEKVANTSYIYSTNYYNKKHKTNFLSLNKICKLKHKKTKGTIVVIGSSAIKIGQGIEFDYASVHAVKSLQKLGYNVVIINNNPETVSTDYSLADRLYFEPINAFIVKQICKFEKAKGVIIQCGGQTALNIAKELKKKHIKIFGTSMKSIVSSEERKKFYKLTKKLHIKQPKSICCKVKKIEKKIKNINFPVIVRPSFVIGGSRMKICENYGELSEYVSVMNKNEIVFVDEFIKGKEAEIDLVADKFGNVFIPLIAEQIDQSGVHSGDSKVLYPSRSISEYQKNIMTKYATILAKKLKVVGLMNIQFVISGDDIYVIEANLRASRTIPAINKVCGVDLVDMAMKAILGEKIVIPKYTIKKARKEPVFSNYKITKQEVPLGCEMRSTGEALYFE